MIFHVFFKKSLIFWHFWYYSKKKVFLILHFFCEFKKYVFWKNLKNVKISIFFRKNMKCFSFSKPFFHFFLNTLKILVSSAVRWSLGFSSIAFVFSITVTSYCSSMQKPRNDQKNSQKIQNFPPNRSKIMKLLVKMQYFCTKYEKII